ncbi:MAG TPA: cytochrome c maturation protein CcmE [Kofleriaceae bacterium]|nr:cytochrome c maturation protein CcmE [Kofleriaceae bacterium]
MGAIVAGIALAAAMRWLQPGPAGAQDMVGGWVKRGTLTSVTPTDHRFALHVEWHDVPALGGLEMSVRYRGVIPDTLCEGEEVIVRGRVTGTHVDAVEVIGGAHSKYDACAHPCRGAPPPGCLDRDLFR